MKTKMPTAFRQSAMGAIYFQIIVVPAGVSKLQISLYPANTPDSNLVYCTVNRYPLSFQSTVVLDDNLMNPSHLDTTLHIPRRNLCQIAHVVHDLTIVQYLDFQLSVAEIHDMAKIDGNILLFCNFQDPTGTVIAAVGGIENLVRQIVDEHQGFYATGKFRWRDKPKSFRFHRIGITDYPFIHSLDHSLV